jgi:hypothetical protein
MNATAARNAWRMIACAAAFACLATRALGAEPVATAAARLDARYAAFKLEPVENALRRPLRMDSTEKGDGASGEIHAVVDFPFAGAGAVLGNPARWCDILMLPLNTKGCLASVEGLRTVLHVRIGKKFDQPADDAYPLDFVYRVATASASYLRVGLDAAQGPLGTRNYLIVLEAQPADAGRTFIRLSYSYAYGLTGRLALAAYLATLGRDKVGFTVVGTQPGGEPRFVGGARGIVERNTMRYYLAIEAFLGALALPPAARQEKSLVDWFSAVEGYPRQLHEMERGEYLDMKRREYARQPAG